MSKKTETEKVENSGTGSLIQKDNNGFIKTPLSKNRTMPGDYSISLGNKGNSDQQLLNPGTKRHHSMRGFEDTYVDIVDYIIRITHRIWEEKDIGYIYDTYAHNSKVNSDFGLQTGREDIVIHTLQMINAFPDIRIFADEVIWAGDDVSGFHTSHRSYIGGTNTGYSQYGPPTHRKMRVLCLANCVILDNEIFDEWVFYDYCHLIGQLGFDARQLAKTFAAEMIPTAFGDQRHGENERLPGLGKPAHLQLSQGSFDITNFIEYYYHYIWNWRNLSIMEKAYAPNIRYHGGNGREYYGIGALSSYILSVLAMFPDAMMQVDDIYWMGNDKDDHMVAVRWSLVGTHTGYGIYGQPTGKPIHMNGASHHRIRDNKIIEEWTLFNEFGLLMQLEGNQPLETENNGEPQAIIVEQTDE
jgi:hypothetical protein